MITLQKTDYQQMEQAAADALPMNGRVHEKQGDMVPLRRQDAQEMLALPGAKCCQAFYLFSI